MITSLFIERTEDTPLINFDIVNDTYEISGISIPEDIRVFYDKITKWMLSFLDERNKPFLLKVYLHYYNTSSNISLVSFFNEIKTHSKSDYCQILWCYEKDDEDMLYKGEELEEMTGLHFQYEAL
jgi:hypothetical protein